MSFLTGGSGGQTSTTNSNSTSSVNYAPWYTDYAKDILARGTELSKTPFQPYDVSKMFAPFQPAQQQAFNQVYNNQVAHWPYMNAATGALNSITGLDPAGAGMPFVNAAAQSPTGMQAGAPYLSMGTQTWNPQVQQQYTNPFFAGSVDFANQLATQNFLERTIPGVNAQFVKSGGGLGGKNYADYMGRTVRDFTNNMIGQNQTAMAGNYWQGANQFNQDMNRYLQAGTNLGGLANNTIGALGQLGQTAAGIQNTGVTSGINTANAYSNLGGALSNLNMQNTNALLQIGNQQQQNAQNPLTAAYQQWQQGVQFPYNQLSWLSNLSSGLRIPSTQNTTSSSTQNVSSNSSPSILGSILGAGSSILGMMGGTSGVGSMFSSLFGGGSNPSFQSLGVNALPNDVYGPAPFRKRGGHIRKYASGGNVLSASGDLGGGAVPGGALGRVQETEDERPKEPTAAESWARSGQDANTSAPGYATGGQFPARNALGMRGYGGTPVGALSTAPQAPQMPMMGSMPPWMMGLGGMPSGGSFGFGGINNMRMPWSLPPQRPSYPLPPMLGGGFSGGQPTMPRPPTMPQLGGGTVYQDSPVTNPAQMNGGMGWAYRRGGAVSRFSQGGTVPVVRGVNHRAQPALSSIAQRMRPPVPLPRPSTGALARAAGPMIGGGGALSVTR